MKTKKAPLLAAILALLTSVAGSCRTSPRANAESCARSPTRKELAGAWIGYDESCLYFYRLDLRADRSGSCVALYAKKAVETYSVDDWRINEGKLCLTLRPRSTASEQITFLPVYVDLVRMDLIVKGLTNQWQRKVTVYNERELMFQVRKSARKVSAIQRSSNVDY